MPQPQPGRDGVPSRAQEAAAAAAAAAAATTVVTTTPQPPSLTPEQLAQREESERREAMRQAQRLADEEASAARRAAAQENYQKAKDLTIEIENIHSEQVRSWQWDSVWAKQPGGLWVCLNPEEARDQAVYNVQLVLGRVDYDLSIQQVLALPMQQRLKQAYRTHLKLIHPQTWTPQPAEVVDDQYDAWVGRFEEAFKFISTAYTELMKEGVPELGRMRDVQARSMQFY